MKTIRKGIITGIGIATYILLPLYSIITEAKDREDLSNKVIAVLDKNSDEFLSIEETWDAYVKMEINPQAIFQNSYDRLRNDEIRLPMKSDLLKLIED